MAILLAFVPVIIFLLLSLFIPTIIVLKWHKRPVWAMITASIIYVLPFILISILGSDKGYKIQDNTHFIYLVSIIIVASLIWLLIGLIFLVPIQMKSRKKRQRRMQSKIDEAF